MKEQAILAIFCLCGPVVALLADHVKGAEVLHSS